MKAFLLSQLRPDAQRSVYFHGNVRRDKLLEVLRCARVAVFPSYAEAFAMAPLEAMAQGCATIYTRRGSGPEVIEHEQDGLLIDPDHPAEIAEAIVRVLADKDLARRLGKAGHRRVQQRFSRAVGLKKNQEFYRTCLRAFGQPRTDSPQLVCSGNSQ
jgi:glycosyltransferase involved in cell wall biosynthesis